MLKKKSPSGNLYYIYGLSISLVWNRTHNPQSKKQDHCKLCQRTRQSIHYMHRSIKTDTTYKIQKKKQYFSQKSCASSQEYGLSLVKRSNRFIHFEALYHCISIDLTEWITQPKERKRFIVSLFQKTFIECNLDSINK